MTQQLPKTIDPIHAAKQGLILSGRLPLKKLLRLCAIHNQLNQEALVEMRFFLDPAGLHVIQGEIKTIVELVCERCNQPVEYPLTLSFCLNPVLSEYQLSRLPESYEPLMMHDTFVEIATIIEDEILLGLPMVAKHEQCPVNLPSYLK